MELFFESVSRWLYEFFIGELLYDIWQGLIYTFSGPYLELSGFFIISIGVSLFFLFIKIIRKFIF